jgi:hypothetical protein
MIASRNNTMKAPNELEKELIAKDESKANNTRTDPRDTAICRDDIEATNSKYRTNRREP